MSIDTVRFTDLDLSSALLKAVDEMGYEAPSPIQAQSIPPLLAGHDLLGQAQTGTGKTAAYALPLLCQLNLSLKSPQILVLTPTRELAIQVAEAMTSFARHLPGFQIVPIYGGQSMETQLRQLKRGAHVIVGSPGRLLDHLRRKTLHLHHLNAVVLDEADEMLRMGFIEDVEDILDQTPEEKQVALFSATMPAPIKKIAQKYLQDPVEIAIKAKTATVSTVTQRYWEVTDLHKMDALTRILEVEDFEGMLVFVRTKTTTADLAEKLEARGYSAAALSGDIKQSLREKIVERLKSGSLDIVVATDVAARGLDVERISHVVNYDVPYDTETYIHRIGRTGRAGREGHAILFISPRERRMLRSIERVTRQSITVMQLPSQADIAERRIQQFKQRIQETIAHEDLSFFETLIQQYQREESLDLSKIAAALTFLVQMERPLVLEDEPIPTASPRREPKDKVRNSRSRGGLPPVPMQSFRVEVGLTHGVQPKHLVGAIANECGLDGEYIQNIALFGDYSTVELPEGMPKDILKYLKKVKVLGVPLKIQPLGQENGSRVKRSKPDKTFQKKRTTGKKKQVAI
jgi:ATP-dependent RNA helicase DeaD